MIDILINNNKYKVPKDYTILQACESIGVQIPRFCYHESLSIAGNCRMCLVELKNAVKPVASCAMSVSDGMEIWTNSLLVKKAREGVMEFLLANHPLDCPICDQGGECDLQDQAMLFGNDRGRFYEAKRSVANKECGPFIKTIMTRCIHCTRCVRFSSELGGLPELGTTGRGNKTEIGNYISTTIKSEVSGNLIDLCPVGALTSKPYSFKARSWELKKTETIDTLDSMCSNVVMYSNNNRIMRVLPAFHEGINENWINDRTRFNYDSFYIQRLTKGYTRNKKGELVVSDWKRIFKKYLLDNNLLLNKNKKVISIVGQGISAEGITELKKLSNYINTSIANELFITNLVQDFRSCFSFNSTFSGISETDFCLLLGVNLQSEMPLLLMRLRKEQRCRNLKIIAFGGQNLEGIVSRNVGNSLVDFIKFLEGRHQACSIHKYAKKPMVIVGNGFLSLNNNKILLETLYKYFQTKCAWNGFNLLLNGSSLYQLLDSGVSFSQLSSNSYISVMNTYGLEQKQSYSPIFFLNYLSSHGSQLSNYFNKILPLTTNFEREGVFFNNEGRVQFTKFVVSGPKEARTDSSLFKSLGLFSFSSKKRLCTSSLDKDLSLSVVNIPKYQTFYCGYNKSQAVINNFALSTEYASILATDYMSISSRLLVDAEKRLYKERCLNFK